MEPAASLPTKARLLQQQLIKCDPTLSAICTQELAQRGVAAASMKEGLTKAALIMLLEVPYSVILFESIQKQQTPERNNASNKLLSPGQLKLMHQRYPQPDLPSRLEEVCRVCCSDDVLVTYTAAMNHVIHYPELPLPGSTVPTAELLDIVERALEFICNAKDLLQQITTMREQHDGKIPTLALPGTTLQSIRESFSPQQLQQARHLSDTAFRELCSQPPVIAALYDVYRDMLQSARHHLPDHSRFELKTFFSQSLSRASGLKLSTIQSFYRQNRGDPELALRLLWTPEVAASLLARGECALTRHLWQLIYALNKLQELALPELDDLEQ